MSNAITSTARNARHFATVTMADGSQYGLTTLLSAADSNVKLSLSDAQGTEYITVGLSLAPSTMAGVKTAAGHDVDLCSHASPVCRTICLVSTGHARVSKSVNRARIAKSRFFLADPAAFKSRLAFEIGKAAVKAAKQGKKLAVRLNVFSDIAWERKFPELFVQFPDVQFYDYTKIPNRKTPANYQLTFSRSEVNHDLAMAHLANGGNVAVVFEDHTFPGTFNGYRVVDGTTHDLRFLDAKNVVVALAEKNTDLVGPQYAGKRNLQVNTTGFVLPTVTSNAFDQPVTLA